MLRFSVICLIFSFAAAEEICPPGQEFNKCGSRCPPTCLEPNRFCTLDCVEGCFCPQGQLLNKYGQCVTLENCKAKICPLDKQYSSCGSRCPPTCANQTQICSTECVKGCFCPRGHVLNYDGKCVTPENCKVSSDEEECGECPDDEIFMECGSACPQTCDSEKPIVNCPAHCVEGCFCPPGKVRDIKSKRCVDLTSCGFCPENEEYICGSRCPLTCQQPNPVPCTKDCAYGCFCKNGTVRDEKTNICVPPKACTKCGINEVFKECGTACPKTCTQPNPTICTKQCVIGCFCKDGYVKDEVTGKCVKLAECKCPTNEIFNLCGSACPATCNNPRKSKSCSNQCIPGCFCAEGLIRDDTTKKCVKPSSCFKCASTEVFKKCGSACPPTCQNPKPQFCTEICIAGCFCPDGYVRNEYTKECVKPSQCPKCPGIEVYHSCGTACPPTCTNLIPTVCTYQCVSGCFCPVGYVRDETTKQCLKPSECKCYKKNEIFEKCGTACPQTCSNPIPRLCKARCRPGCFCTDGFVRNESTRECVKLSQCKKCQINEEYKECGSSCPPTCKDPNPNLCNDLCVKGCFCRSGYVRDDLGFCVPLETCLKNCTVGEIYDECGSACPLTCDGKPEVCTQQCVAGCQCEADLVRDEFTGKCIPMEQCPKNDSCTNPNERFSSCGTNCEPTCSEPNPSCNKACKIGCFCEEGYIRNSENKCIPNDQC